MASAPEPETERGTGEPGAIPWVGIALAVVLGAVALWAWDRVQLWTQIVLISLTGLAVVILLVAVTLRRGARRVPRVRDTTAASQWRAARLFLYAALGLAVISASFVAAILILKASHVPLPEQFVLPMLLIGGTVAMLLTIAIVAVVFAGFRLSDSSAALALPEGSVRAVIALLLILVFAIMAVFLYASLLNGSERVFKGITQAQLDVLPKDQIVSIQKDGTEAGQPLFDVVMNIPANSAAQDFAKQLLTTVSTLVVAISAFYFGARTAAGAAAGEPPVLKIKSPKSPAPAPPTGEKLKISLEARPKGTGVKWEFQAGGGTLEQAKPDDDTEWVWSPPDPPVATAIRFYLADYPDVAQVLEIQGPGEQPAPRGDGTPPGPDIDLGDEGDSEPLPTDESPEATAEAGLTETGVQPDEDVPFEDGQDESGQGESTPGGVGP